MNEREASAAGRVEQWFDRRVRGVVMADDPAAPPAVEFRVAGRTIAAAPAGARRADGGYDFSAVLDIPGGPVEVVRAGDGCPLDASPVLLVPQPPPAEAGIIEAWYGRKLAGVAIGSVDAPPPVIEFLVDGAVVGTVVATRRDAEPGRFGFRVQLDLVGEAVHVAARRREDGAVLVNSLVLVHPAQADRPPVAMPAPRHVVVRPIAAPPGREVALVALRSHGGRVAPHVPALVAALARQGVPPVLIASTDRPIDLPPDLLGLTAGAIVREAAGGDFAGWGHALAIEPMLYGAGRLYLLSDRLFGPATDDRLAAMLDRVRASDASLLALAAGAGEARIDPSFLAVAPRLLAALDFHQLMRDVPIAGDADATDRAVAAQLAFFAERGEHSLTVLHRGVSPHGGWAGRGAASVPFLMLPLPPGEADETRSALADAGFAPVPPGDGETETVAPHATGHLLARNAGAGEADARPARVAFLGPWDRDDRLGDSARALLAALRRTATPLALHAAGPPSGGRSPLPVANVSDFTGPADVAVVALEPGDWRHLTADQRDVVAGAARRIACWTRADTPLPPSWWAAFDGVDRIWSLADAPAPELDAPVETMPPPVAPTPPPADARARLLARLGLDATTRLAVHVTCRAAPERSAAQVIEAFAAAGLVWHGWALAIDPGDTDLPPGADRKAGVHVLSHPDRATRLALVAAADLFLAPHAAEAADLAAAEAGAFGRLVLALGLTGAAEDTARVTIALAEAAAAIERGTPPVPAATGAAIDRGYAAVAARMAASIAATRAAPSLPPAIPRIAGPLARGVRFADATLDPALIPVPLGRDPVVPAAVSPAEIADDRDRWLVLAPADALIPPRFGRVVLQHARARPDVAIFYADDVALGADRPIDQVRLKPELDITLLAAQDYVGWPLIVRASAWKALGGLGRAKAPAAKDALLFRAHAAGMGVARIPEVLLGLAGARAPAPPEARRSALSRLPAFAGHDLVAGRAPGLLETRFRFTPDTTPEVTLLIAGGADPAALLDAAARADWPMGRLRAIVAGGGETRDAPFPVRRLGGAAGEDRVALLDRLWRAAETEQIVFLDAALVPTGPGWLAALETFARDEGVGGVGARILDAAGGLRHAGVAPFRHGPDHAWRGRVRLDGSYQDWALAQREWSMLSGGAFATRRSVMEQVNGFDSHFAGGLHDLDLCLRLRMAGLRLIHTPGAEFIDHGDPAPPPDGVALGWFRARWRAVLEADPAFHPGLDPDRVALAPRIRADDWYR